MASAEWRAGINWDGKEETSRRQRGRENARQRGRMGAMWKLPGLRASGDRLVLHCTLYGVRSMYVATSAQVPTLDKVPMALRRFDSGCD
jgi:hypothetical protein